MEAADIECMKYSRSASAGQSGLQSDGGFDVLLYAKRHLKQPRLRTWSIYMMLQEASGGGEVVSAVWTVCGDGGF